MPKWLLYATASLLSWALWSLISPIANRDLSPYAVQIVSSLGLIPFTACLLGSSALRRGANFRRGLLLAFSTGVTAVIGNVLLYEALSSGGPVSIVFPVTSMAPLVPVLAAPLLFAEKLRPVQMAGIGLALVAIVLLNISRVKAPSSSRTLLRVREARKTETSLGNRAQRRRIFASGRAPIPLDALYDPLPSRLWHYVSHTEGGHVLYLR
jgi:uncharacterized membrane protein